MFFHNPIIFITDMKTPESTIKLKNYSGKKNPLFGNSPFNLGKVRTPNNTNNLIAPSDLGKITKSSSKINLEKIPSSLEAKSTNSSNALLRKVVSTTIKGNGRIEKQIVQVAIDYMDPNTYVTPNPQWPDTTGYVADSTYIEV